jgi:hypothetical protein
MCCARRVRVKTSPRGLRGGWRLSGGIRLTALVTILVALAVPQAAHAHFRTGAVAVDFRARVAPLEPQLLSALSARVSASDLALRLTVREGHAVLVRGYLGEPFLRLGGHRVEVNTTSPTAAGTGLLKHLPSGSGSGWRLLSSRSSVVWHDARLRGLPSGVERRAWSVPLVVDGQGARLTGEVWRDHAPAPWPWIVLALPFLAITVWLLILRSGSVVRPATVVLGAIAAVALLVSIAGFALDPNAVAATYIEGGNEAVFALVGMTFLFRGPPGSRAIAGGALGLLAVAVGLTKVPVLLHGVVLSVLPPTAARAGVVLMLAAGVAATALGLVVLFEMMEWDEEPPAHRRPA